jgi:hypothetical protein
MSPVVRWFPGFLLLTFVTLPLETVCGAQDVSEPVAAYLRQGQFAACETELQQILSAEPMHAQARFALGVVQVLIAIEKLGQDQYLDGAMNGTIRRNRSTSISG